MARFLQSRLLRSQQVFLREVGKDEGRSTGQEKVKSNIKVEVTETEDSGGAFITL